jgi:hypothetical protein
MGWIELMHETGRGGELAWAVLVIFAGAIATHWLLTHRRFAAIPHGDNVDDSSCEGEPKMRLDEMRRLHLRPPGTLRSKRSSPLAKLRQRISVVMEADNARCLEAYNTGKPAAFPAM